MLGKDSDFESFNLLIYLIFYKTNIVMPNIRLYRLSGIRLLDSPDIRPAEYPTKNSIRCIPNCNAIIKPVAVHI
jgi:hypothetical protein